ncbi:hypothetical protein U8326_11060 [Tsuneonella sp. CC-YZS046]|uniref:hypothetical protein n=1 Tax=Tsuneonella sp. CC-YZS046 TaxID=3042152 RepID=UPI002D771061|nr:hypothetical protein [Tsuneonella sp. CC-YZS046]WRO65590.1 hypothetical protein U8326_11060 [Tsuneonella sp. CC-YZS046]
MGRISNSPLMRNARWRRLVLGALVLVCLLFSVFPERYRAASTLTPTDPSSLGLSGALGQLGALNTVFGNQAAVEVSLKIGRSVYTRGVVIKQLNLVDRLGFDNEIEASRWMERNVEISSLRGGIVQVECVNRDAKLATDLVATVTAALREQLGKIALRQTEYKRDILLKLVEDANTRLAKAQADYNNFRLTTRYSDPKFAIDSIGQRIPALETAIKAKEVELNAARQFATDDNMSVRQIIAQLDALHRQLKQLQDINPKEDNSIGLVVKQSTEAERLERELALAKSLYYSYRRFLEGTSVEDLTSSANIRVLEQPFIDTDRQYRLIPLALAMLIALLAGAIEFYRLRPPVSETKSVE